MGSSFEALLAGKTPNIRPIDPEIIIVEIVVREPTEAGKGVTIPNMKTPVKPVVVPTKPPIVDRINADVTVFDSHGSFFKKAGYKDGLVKIMNEPVAAAVDQRGILYVCDMNKSAIYRFKLSNTLNEDLEQED